MPRSMLLFNKNIKVSRNINFEMLMVKSYTYFGMITVKPETKSTIFYLLVVKIKHCIRIMII